MTVLKFAIYVTFFFMVISLIAAAIFLMQDEGKQKRKRTMYALGARIGFAILLMSLVSYGIFSGQLVSQAPWSYSNSVESSDIQKP